MTLPRFPYHRAPVGLRERIQGALERETSTAVRPIRRLPWLPWLAGIAAALLCGIGGWSVAALRRAADAEAAAVLDAHLRALVPGHLADVASTDQHTVKPWFAGKLPFSPPVVDPAAAGFPLVAGRVDVIEGVSTAALVYSRRNHVIDLFVHPAVDGATRSRRESARQGYNLIGWSDGRMEYWAVSDLNREELRQFTTLIVVPY